MRENIGQQISEKDISNDNVTEYSSSSKSYDTEDSLSDDALNEALDCIEDILKIKNIDRLADIQVFSASEYDIDNDNFELSTFFLKIRLHSLLLKGKKGYYQGTVK